MADTVRIPARDRTDRPPRKESAPRTSQPPRDATSRGDGGNTGGTAHDPAPSRPRRRTAADKRIVESLTGMYAMVGSGMSGVGMVQQNAGLIAAGINVTVQGEAIANQWLDLGDEIPAVRRGLESMLKGGAVTVIAMSHIGLVLPALAAAGIVPQQVGNTFLAPEAVEGAMAWQASQQAQAQANGAPSA